MVLGVTYSKNRYWKKQKAGIGLGGVAQEVERMLCKALISNRPRG
jgi:hypothetical protein